MAKESYKRVFRSEASCIIVKANLIQQHPSAVFVKIVNYITALPHLNLSCALSVKLECLQVMKTSDLSSLFQRTLIYNLLLEFHHFRCFEKHS